MKNTAIVLFAALTASPVYAELGGTPSMAAYAPCDVLGPTCDAAIAASASPKDKAHLLLGRAYANNEHNHSLETLTDLNESLKLDPGNPVALHERAYSLNSLGRYAEALDDLNAELPNSRDPAQTFQERAYTYHRLANFAAEYADRDQEVRLQPGQPGTLSARATASLWLGHFEAARADATAALALANRLSAQEDVASATGLLHRVDLWTGVPSDREPPVPARCVMGAMESPEVALIQIRNCTAAFVEAASAAAKAVALTNRQVAWPFLPDTKGAAIEDLQIAAALDPNNGERHANLGFAYTGDRHSWAGLEEFNKAIALGESSFAVFGGRANANYNLRNYKEAFADAKKSYEMKPNEIALYVLGDLAFNVLKDNKAAKEYWLGAYHLGARDDRLMERLRQVGVEHPK